MSTISLTAWWKELQESLQSLDKRFPGLFDNHQPYNAASDMAKSGIQLEKAWRIHLLPLALGIKEDSKKLGTPVKGYEDEIDYIPKIDSPSDALLALIYYQHLCAFKNVVSKQEYLQDGSFGKPGISSRKPVIAAQASSLKEYIDKYLRDSKNVESLKQAFPQFKDIYNSGHHPFDILTALATGVTLTPVTSAEPSEPKPPAQPPSTKPFEENLGLVLMKTLAEADETASTPQENPMTKVISTLEKVRICKKFLTLVQMSPQDLMLTDTSETLNELVNANIPELVKQAHNFEDYLKRLKTSRNDTPRESTETAEKSSSEDSSDKDSDSDPDSALINSTYLLFNAGVASFKLAFLLAQSTRNLLFGKSASEEERTEVKVEKKQAPKTKQDTHLEELMMIRHKASQLLQEQLDGLNHDELTFHTADLESRSDKNLQLIIAKATLLQEIEQRIEKTEKSLKNYIEKNRKPAFEILKPAYHFLDKIYRYIYQKNWTFLKEYFVPAKWKCTFAADELRTILSQLKQEMKTKKDADPTAIRSTLKTQKALSKRAIDAIQEHSFFSCSHKQTKALKKELNKTIKNIRSSKPSKS